jgi:hypothetical protein
MTRNSFSAAGNEARTASQERVRNGRKTRDEFAKAP